MAEAERLTVVLGNGRIYVKQYSDAGGNVMEMTTGDGLGAPGVNAEFPSVALDTAGNPFVAWQDDSIGNAEIYIKTWQP